MKIEFKRGDANLIPYDPWPPFIVLSPAQIGHWDLVCGFRSRYPWVQIIAQKPLLTQSNSNRPPE